MKIYGEIGYFDPGIDFLGARKSWPNAYAYMNYMGGAELEYYFTQKLRWLGGVFAAANVSAYQQNGFGKNVNFTAGYILPQERNKLRLRLGIPTFKVANFKQNRWHNLLIRVGNFKINPDFYT